MVVIISTVFAKKSLEDVAEAPGEEVATIMTKELDAIITLPGWVTIYVLLKDTRKGVWGHRDFVPNITLSKFITEDLVTVLREFRFELWRVSFTRIKPGGSVKYEYMFNARIIDNYVTSCRNHVLRGYIDFLLEIIQFGVIHCCGVTV